MKTHTFKRKDDDALIILPCYFLKDEFAIALDTGASHTTIDLNVLYMAGIIEYLEDPCRGQANMAAVKKALKTPLATNMCTTSFEDIPLSIFE